MCLAIPGRIVEVLDASRHLAKVEVAGVRRTVNIQLLETTDGSVTGPGDWVLVHVGFAISRVDEAEARATLRLLEGAGEEFEREIEQLKQDAVP
jgi:hydrogenase expression/formation protein HypC